MSHPFDAAISRLMSRKRTVDFLVDKYEKDDRDPERFRLDIRREESESCAFAIRFLKEAATIDKQRTIGALSTIEANLSYYGSDVNKKSIDWFVGSVWKLISCLPNPDKKNE